MLDSTRVAVVMPAYNEHAGIGQFLDEIDAGMAAAGIVPEYVVVDDHSEIELAPILATTLPASRGNRVVVVRNDANRGHGPSALRAYREGLARGAEVIVHVDGDGQFSGDDVVAVCLAIVGADLVRGERSGRDAPWFRRAATATARRLVGVSGDANSPLRAYRRAILLQLLAATPPDASVPHLHFSRHEAAMPRRASVSVVFRPRRGECSEGTTWGVARRRRVLPPRRFVIFAWRATQEVLRASKPVTSQPLATTSTSSGPVAPSPDVNLAALAVTARPTPAFDLANSDPLPPVLHERPSG